MNESNVQRGCPHPYKKGLLRVSFSIDILETLGEVQLEVLYMYWIENRTVKDIAKTRKTCVSAVKNVKAKLISKGIIDELWRPMKTSKSYQNNEGGDPTLSPQNDKGEYRLHGQNQSIKILSTSKEYLKLNFPVKLVIDTNTIMLYRRKVTIYSNVSFYDDIPNLCFEKADVYWTNFINKISSKYKINLINGNDTEINIFRQHIAKTNDPLAKKVITNKFKYEWRDDLGRLRLLIDNSKGLFEFEAVEKEMCQEDINRIRDYQGDIISKDSFMPSEVKIFLKELKEGLEINKDTSQNILKSLEILVSEVDNLKNDSYGWKKYT